LDRVSLLNVGQVCKQWARIVEDGSLWDNQSKECFLITKRNESLQHREEYLEQIEQIHGDVVGKMAREFSETFVHFDNSYSNYLPLPRIVACMIALGEYPAREVSQEVFDKHARSGESSCKWNLVHTPTRECKVMFHDDFVDEMLQRQYFSVEFPNVTDLVGSFYT